MLGKNYIGFVRMVNAQGTMIGFIILFVYIHILGESKLKILFLIIFSNFILIFQVFPILPFFFLFYHVILKMFYNAQNFWCCLYKLEKIEKDKNCNNKKMFCVVVSLELYAKSERQMKIKLQDDQHANQ